MSNASDSAPEDTPSGGPPPAAAPQAEGVDCLCLGLGPQLTQAIRALLAVDGVAKTLHGAELDALKLVRSLIDQRITCLTTTPADTRGTKVSVE